MNEINEDIDYGPLGQLIGTWKGDQGMDVAPEPEDDEYNPYYETLVFEAAGDVSNAEEQTLAIVRYHQEVSRKSTGKVFHDQVGYWLWNAATGEVIQTLTIPRGVTLLAAGTAVTKGKQTTLHVKTNDPDWGIIEAPFMKQKAHTVSFNHVLKIEGDRIFYQETTLLDIYGKKNYEHIDQNTLHRHRG